MEKPEDAATDVNAYPLIAYIHVPKAAGSTIKTILGLCTPHQDRNIQFLMKDRDSLLSLARNSHWIGGHAQRDRLASRLTWLNRPIEYYSSVREPLAQLVSHLNFSFHRFLQPNYYVNHNVDEQRLDAEVMSVDFSNSAAVMNLLLRHAHHYLNVQSRYVLGVDFRDISNGEIARRLASYTYVALESEVPKLSRAFGFAQLPRDVDKISENVSKLHIDTRVFDSPQLQEFLDHHHRHDARLYAAVRGARWPAEGRRPFRPAWLARDVTSDNFDERAYLESNPDVAVAVQSGDFESGRHHFLQLGCTESRRMWQWIFPPAVATKPKSPNAALYASSVLDRLRASREERARLVAG